MAEKVDPSKKPSQRHEIYLLWGTFISLGIHNVYIIKYTYIYKYIYPDQQEPGISQGLAVDPGFRIKTQGFEFCTPSTRSTDVAFSCSTLRWLYNCLHVRALAWITQSKTHKSFKIV
jgi:hypothetical protein